MRERPKARRTRRGLQITGFVLVAVGVGLVAVEWEEALAAAGSAPAPSALAPLPPDRFTGRPLETTTEDGALCAVRSVGTEGPAHDPMAGPIVWELPCGRATLR